MNSIYSYAKIHLQIWLPGFSDTCLINLPFCDKNTPYMSPWLRREAEEIQFEKLHIYTRRTEDLITSKFIYAVSLLVEYSPKLSSS